MELASRIINREANLLKNRTEEMKVIFKDLGYNDINESWDTQVIDRWVEADNQEESTNGFFGNRALECDPMIQNCTILNHRITFKSSISKKSVCRFFLIVSFNPPIYYLCIPRFINIIIS